MSTLSTHVLDTATGTPAAGVPVRLETRAGEHLDQARQRLLLVVAGDHHGELDRRG